MCYWFMFIVIENNRHIEQFSILKKFKKKHIPKRVSSPAHLKYTDLTAYHSDITKYPDLNLKLWKELIPVLVVCVSFVSLLLSRGEKGTNTYSMSFQFSLGLVIMYNFVQSANQ